MIGHVTSSYLSPTLGRSIAMAVVKGGHQRAGRHGAGGAERRQRGAGDHRLDRV